MRNNSSASVDQGYISASPCTTDLGVVSPPTHANRTTPNSSSQQQTAATYSKATNKFSNDKYNKQQRIPSPLLFQQQQDVSTQPMFIRRNEAAQLAGYITKTSSSDHPDYGSPITNQQMTAAATAFCEAFITDPFFTPSAEDAHSFLSDNTSKSSLFPYPLGRNDDGGWKQPNSKKQQHSVSLPLVEGKEVDFAKMWRSPPAHPQVIILCKM